MACTDPLNNKAGSRFELLPVLLSIGQRQKSSARRSFNFGQPQLSSSTGSKIRSVNVRRERDRVRRRIFSFGESNGASLEEINATIAVPEKNSGFFRNLRAFLGPGALVAVGYMDPGNWVTSIGGGQQFGYLLLFVIAISSLVAMLLQHMCVKLGLVTRQDLAQITRSHTSKTAGVILWVIAELAIMATDVAEVIGAAIALNLLFGLHLVWGVLLTVGDVFLLLLLLRVGIRKIEAIVVTLITTILLVFCYEVWVASPDMASMFSGFIPNAQVLGRSELAMALGIIGATVMPHNLYLHSAIVQSRAVNQQDKSAVARAVRFATWDSNLQLGGAFFINCLLLVLGAAFFFGVPGEFATLGGVYDALQDPQIAGRVASPLLSTLFAVALLASGQNSTITGTLTGQVIMEGFIRLHMPLWLRRLVTRVAAVIPVMICAVLFGESEVAMEQLLVDSQIFLCLALPISMVTVVWFTSSAKIMGEFKNPLWMQILGWVITVVLSVLNISLIVQIIF